MKPLETQESPAGQRADRRALAEIGDLVEDGVYETASVLAWEVQRAAPGDPAVWLLLTQIDFRRERYAAAMYASRMATRLDPSWATAWLWLARTAVTRARWRTEGLDAALQATALAPEDPATWTVLARHHLAQGAQYEAAIAAERAARIGPDHTPAHRVLADIAVAADEHVHAVAAFRGVLALAPGDRDARSGLSTALRALGRDPAEELADLDGMDSASASLPDRLLRLSSNAAAPTAAAALRRRRTPLAAVLGCVLAGALVGLVVPTVGVLRGLIAAVAVLLMWYAVRPWRTVPPEPAPAVAVDEGTDDVATSDAATAAAAATVVATRAPSAATGVAVPDRGASDAGSAATDDDTRRIVAAEVTRAEPLGLDEPAPAPTAARDPEPAVEPEHGFDLPDSTDELVALSHDKLAELDLETAGAAANRLQAVAPDSVQAHRALAAVALAQQSYAQAEHHYELVLESEPLDQEAHERLAMARKGRLRAEKQVQRPSRRRAR